MPNDSQFSTSGASSACLPACLPIVATSQLIEFILHLLFHWIVSRFFSSCRLPLSQAVVSSVHKISIGLDSPFLLCPVTIGSREEYEQKKAKIKFRSSGHKASQRSQWMHELIFAVDKVIFCCSLLHRKLENSSAALYVPIQNECFLLSFGFAVSPHRHRVWQMCPVHRSAVSILVLLYSLSLRLFFHNLIIIFLCG